MFHAYLKGPHHFDGSILEGKADEKTKVIISAG